MDVPAPLDLEALRQRIRLLERPAARGEGVVAFGVAEIDGFLPEGGLSRGALHEVWGGGVDAGFGACAAGFVAGVLARMAGGVLWCGVAGDVFAPGLAGVGLAADRVIYARADDDKGVLLAMEEALRHAGLAAVVGELGRLGMIASRRLALAAEKSGVMAVALRRCREGRGEEGGVNAATTRWRVGPVPSAGLAVAGLGPARWEVALVRCRNGAAKTWVMEGCDAQGRLCVPAELAGGSVAATRLRRAR